MDKVTEARVQRALAELPDEGRTAVQILASMAAEDPQMPRDQTALEDATMQACLQALASHGWDMSDKPRVQTWLDAHGFNVARIIVGVMQAAE